MTYGYARVSTKNQNEDRQLIAMKEFGVREKNIFCDKQSGKDFDRPAYQKLTAKLKTNDVLVIKSIDRLGRSYYEIIDQWRFITKDLKASIVVIDMPILDTRKKDDLIASFVSDIVLQILSFVAQNERASILQRQAEGIAAAKARGVKFGRAPFKRPDVFRTLKKRYRKNKISSRRAAKALGVCHTTFLNWIAE